MKTFIKAVAISVLALLAACSSTPQASTDAVEEMAALAGSDGNLEATLEVVSVGSIAVSGHNPEGIQLESFRVTHKGKPIKGFSFGAQPTGQVSAALAAGDRVKVRGRVRNIKGIPAFVGVMQPESTQASTAAVTPSASVILVGASKTLPGPTGTSVRPINNAEVSFVFHTITWTFMTIQTASGMGVFRASTPGAGLNVGKTYPGRLNGQLEVIQTPLGPIGKVTGVLTYGQNKTVEVQGLMEEEVFFYY